MNAINRWKDGILGLVTGDALGNPVQFMNRKEISLRCPVTGMRAGGPYDTPAGTWTDDSSMALCTLCSMLDKGQVDPQDIMRNFVKWDRDGEFTPFGEAFDQGNTCLRAIDAFKAGKSWEACGGRSESSNGNGSLMRILPVCLLHTMKNSPAEEAIRDVHNVSALTHAHPRAKIGCGLYLFLVQAMIRETGDLHSRLLAGIRNGFDFYRADPQYMVDLCYYSQLFDFKALETTPVQEIRSGGYVVDALVSAVWNLLTTTSFRDCLLQTVNLGDDSDTVGAIAGGLAGLYYGADSIPDDWLNALQRLEWIEALCEQAGEKFGRE